MGYYLLDNPPRSPQFYPSRNATPTYAIGVHTSEGPTGPGTARNLAGFIARRSDPGSYHAIVDSEETVVLVPPSFTTFSVAVSNYNSRTWHICLAGRSADLSPDDANTQAMIARAGEAIRALWTLLGISLSNAQWIGTDALNRPGLFCHGDVQPWDRSDAWSKHPDRARLDQMLINAIAPPTPPIPPTPQDDDMKRYLLRGDKSGEIYLADAGLGWKWHIPAGQLENVVWVITQSSGGQFLIPPGANTLVFEGQTVWVADQAFVDAIPTI
jgi:hypothetical protein